MSLEVVSTVGMIFAAIFVLAFAMWLLDGGTPASEEEVIEGGILIDARDDADHRIYEGYLRHGR